MLLGPKLQHLAAVADAAQVRIGPLNQPAAAVPHPPAHRVDADRLVPVQQHHNGEAAREALRRGEVDLLFGDGIQLAFWLNGTDSANCCEFRGGPFTESRYFGEGIGIAVRRGNETLRLAMNWALFRLWERGRFTDLWLRYFPINPF